MFSFRGIASFDGSAFVAGLNRLAVLSDAAGDKIGQSFSKGIVNRLGAAFGFGALALTLKGIAQAGAEYAASLKDISEQHDLTIDEVQRLQKLADDAGLSFDDLGNAISHFGDIRKNAIRGDQEARKQLEQYGLVLNDILDPTQRNIALFEKMGKALEGVKLTPEQRADLKEIFGKKGDRIASSIGQFSSVRVNGALTQADVDSADRAMKDYEGLVMWSKRFSGRIFGGLGFLNEWRKDPGVEFKRQIATLGGGPVITPSGKLTDAAGRDGESTINGSSDPLFFKEESAHAKEMNALYQKGLEIQFERMGTLGRIREMNREIAALEIQKAEADSGTSDRDKQESNEISREIAKKKMELENFRRGVNVGGAQYDLSERQRIGAFAGNMNNLLNVNQQQAKTLEMILSVLRATPKTKGISLRVR